MDKSAPSRGSLFSSLPADREVEHVATLAQLGDVQVERIVSFGQCSPPGFWYDQEHSEWVVVLHGSAKLTIEGRAQSVSLGPGDYVDLPAHTRHRVDWTTPDEPTIWLAIHY
jgi:cupin 2 domain-containing protein